MSVPPVVSVIIPTYNREAYLREAVESVFAQTYRHWELLVIDDGSTDGTRPYLETITDPRVRPILRDHSGSRGLRCNEAARVARGSYLAFLDSDDVWLPEKLARQVEDLDAHGDRRWAYTGRVCVDEHGREIDWLNRRPWVAYDGWVLEHVIAVRARIHSSAIMVERRLFEAVGGFNESLLRCQDRDLSIKLAETSPVSALAAPLVKKRVHPEQRGTQQLDVLRYMDQIYRDLLQRTTSGRLRRLCRLWRARVSLDVVHGCRGAGRYAEARRALWVSFRHAGWHAGWWAALIKTLLRPVVPGPLVALYARAWGRHDRVTASPDGRYLSA